MKQYVQYCEALAENYKQYRINMHQQSIINPPSGREDCRTYAAEQLAGIANGTERLMKFRLSEGKKYWKVIQQNPNSEGGYSDARLLLLFHLMGEVFKPVISWRAPAKGVRTTLELSKREKQLDPKKATWTGGSLYYR